MQINVRYPDEQAERDIVLSTTGNNQAEVQPVLQAQDLMALQHLVRDMPVGDKVVDQIIQLVRTLRPGPDAHDLVNEYVTWAPGPRGSQGLMQAVRARALLQGRSAPLADDVVAMAAPVLRHRMALNFKARAQGINLDHVIHEIAQSI